jgi:BirA family biotin operon repressor/biotin-[acetyl-CoA-carboxylase] ligase
VERLEIQPGVVLPDELSAALALVGARLEFFAGKVRWFPQVGSTNDVATMLAERGAEEGVVVVADQQTAGRGRLGRTWASPPGAGIYMSAILRPSPRAATLLTIAAGVAVADAVAQATGLDVQLKWPNDVYVADRKLAGILAEGAPRYVVLGIGINVLPAAYPSDVARRATSIETELGRPIDRGLLLAECLAALALRYGEISHEDGRGVIAAWRKRAASTIGRRIEWDAGGQNQRGLVDGIDADGALLVRSGSQVIRITSGEVRWV